MKNRSFKLTSTMFSDEKSNIRQNYQPKMQKVMN